MFEIKARYKLACLLMFVLTVAGCGASSMSEAGGGTMQQASSSERAPRPGHLAPKLPDSGVTWINTKPLTLKQLRGKVVLIDFWEYTCINCIREMPFEKKIYKRYKPYGLVILGIHAPEFNIAYNTDNVRQAVKRFKLPWPIAQDKFYSIWKAYNNHSWPSYFLINKNGVVANHWSGEGHEAKIEKRIQKLLAAKNPNFDPSKFPIKNEKPAFGAGCGGMTPEMYVGNKYGKGSLQNDKGYGSGVRQFSADEKPRDGMVVLNGKWKTTDDGASYEGPTQTPASSGEGRASEHGRLTIRYHAREIYSVINASPIGDQPRAIKRMEGKHMVFNTDEPGKTKHKPVKLYIQQDGKYLPRNIADVDVKFDQAGRSYILIDEPRMYYLVRNQKDSSHLLTLTPAAPGVTVNSFTFGNNCTLDFDRL